MSCILQITFQILYIMHTIFFYKLGNLSFLYVKSA